MTPDKQSKFSSVPPRQKIVALIFLIVLIIIIWQLVGLFGGGSRPTTPETPPAANNRTAAPAPATTAAKPGTTTPTTPAPAAAPGTPQPASLSTAGMSQRELQLAQLQQESQAKYMSALNDLQMLKIQRDIAEQNQAIATAKLSAVTSQKKMLDMLTPQAPPPSAQTIKPVTAPVQTITSPALSSSSAYTVISVSLIQGQWSAVVNSQGNLYSVRSGDILPADGAKVMSIDKGGINLLYKDGSRKRVSLVPII